MRGKPDRAMRRGSGGEKGEFSNIDRGRRRKYCEGRKGLWKEGKTRLVRREGGK